MKTEMDLLRFDERQRLAWLMANRGTVFAVGITWIGWIVYELTRGRVPLFMIGMVPVFALLRVALYFYYCSSAGESQERSRGARLGDWLKTVASWLLVLALFLPLYGFSDSGRVDGEALQRESRYVWELVLHHEWTLVFPLSFAFLWPLGLRIVERRASSPRIALLAHWAEPLLAAMSIVTLLLLSQVLFESRQVLWFTFVLESARPLAGCYLAVAANGLFVVGWLSSLLRADLLPASPGA
jgi:hypothetical protein